MSLIIIILWKRCACRLTLGWANFLHEGPHLKILKPKIGTTKKSLTPSVIFVVKTWQKISVTGIASLHLKSKIEWLAEQKSSGSKSNDGFRIDQLCLLALACYTFMDVPNSWKPLLMY